MSEELTAEELAMDEAMAKGEEPVRKVETDEASADQAAPEVADASGESEAEAEGQKAAQSAPEAPKTEQEQAKPPEGYVPHQAMHQERMKRQQAEQALAEMQQRIAKLENPAEPEPQMPDPLTDPKGFAAYQAQRDKATADRVAQIERDRQAEIQQMQRRQMAGRLEQEFAAKTPDYLEATKFLLDNRQKELTAMGFGPDRVRQIVGQDANNIFDNAMQSGQNPAAMIYEQAKLRGWKAPAPAQSAPSEVEKMAAVAAAQKNTASLSTVSGGEPAKGQRTLADLASLSEGEIADLPEAEFKKALGY